MTSIPSTRQQKTTMNAGITSRENPENPPDTKGTVRAKAGSFDRRRDDALSAPDSWRESRVLSHVLQVHRIERMAQNEELHQANEEIGESRRNLRIARQELEELREIVIERDLALRKNETALMEALSEKEVLLAEIHHRVKNNLTAIISLLYLDEGEGDSLREKNMRADLVNRARSMALIHETLYRTKKYSGIDMGIYVRNLVDQIALSYPAAELPQIHVDARGVVIDIDRATSCGLIINELVTNALKHAFPKGYDCRKIRHEPPAIRVSMVQAGGACALEVLDNGVGLPPWIDVQAAPTLGLKLVNFLAKHQLRAKVDIDTSTGTEYLIRFVLPSKESRKKRPVCSD